MRKGATLQQWKFTKDQANGPWQKITVPHTWNALDGQDGGDDYYRGTGWYSCVFSAVPGQESLLVFEGANHTARVWCNGQLAGEHWGGFSRFIVDVSAMAQPGENQLLVCVDNTADRHVYPMQADFTFFGGLYRPVSLVQFDGPHFAYGRYGGEGVYIDADANGRVCVRAEVTGGEAVCVEIADALGRGVACAEMMAPQDGGTAECKLEVKAPHLWQGVEDPYLYSARVRLLAAGEEADVLTVPFGLRSFAVDKGKGFLLNGKPYPLRGVARHQDRQDKGWALNEQDHEEDMRLIQEIGANTVRLAHYQHAQPTYALCDTLGFVVWAEIPFITVFDPDLHAVENTKTQLAELIEQNRNHPSICFWGIANELGIGGESTAMLENLCELNELAHVLDPSRPTTIANLGATRPDSGLCQATDLLGFNMYLGWYDGEPEDVGPFLDKLHADFKRPVALSEYGAEALVQWHSETPRKKDYTEEYQAIVHEEALKALETRPFVWGSWVWNMFDFAADARDEGGCKGRNNKGLVTYDRQIKKDAFYLYKAFWSQQPFVHITGRRFRQRRAQCIDVKVYSNCGQVALLLNGTQLAVHNSQGIFLFRGVQLCEGENVLEAVACGVCDCVRLLHTLSPTERYTAPQPEKAVNEDVAQWFAALQPAARELTYPEGRLSVKESMSVLLSYPQAVEALEQYIVYPLRTVDERMAARFASGGEMTMLAIWGHIQNKLPDEAILLLNEALSKIKK